MLDVQGLGVTRDGCNLVRDVSFKVESGEFVALVGPNGAGKSSCLKAITGEWPAHGEIIIAGKPLSQWRAADLALRLAVMPQSPSLRFDFLVHEVVMLGRLPHRFAGRPEEDRAAAARALAAVNLDHLKDRRYLGLSGGERQRVQLARVLAQADSGDDAGQLLLLDEPTSALDLAQQQTALAAARRHARAGGAVLAVLHDLNLAAVFADRLLVLKEGQIVGEGPPQRVLQSSLIEQWYGCKVETATTLSGRIATLALGQGWPG
ncbi:MAG: hypothetical protein ABS49_03105 [Erythrobacter sp. SCN 62-14]|nr:MAG: hypothetical protein ABS49_03105 [Erythrobacter sp. SCN 62-14]